MNYSLVEKGKNTNIHYPVNQGYKGIICNQSIFISFA